MDIIPLRGYKILCLLYEKHV